MTRVFVDPSAVTLPVAAGAGSSTRVGPDVRVDPGAIHALRNLTEAECEVVLLTDRMPPELDDLAPRVSAASELPRPLGPDAWFLTGDPASPYGRPRGARTILVGPKRAQGPIPLPRFDVEARDLPAAVIEILARQAMV